MDWIQPKLVWHVVGISTLQELLNAVARRSERPLSGVPKCDRATIDLLRKMVQFRQRESTIVDGSYKPYE